MKSNAGSFKKITKIQNLQPDSSGKQKEDTKTCNIWNANVILL